MPENKCSIQCYIELDDLIMSRDCSPRFLEENLGVPDDVLYDAISYSTCANWLLKLDYLKEFSPEFRRRLYKCITAFSIIHRVYFLLQLHESGYTNLLMEYEDVNPPSQFEQNIQLYNPMKNLTNRWREKECKLLDGSLDLHEMIKSSIRDFMRCGDKELIDFSYSLFMPEILSPKFFMDAEDCERFTILGMYDKYSETIKSLALKRFANPLSSGIIIKRELNPLIALVKHILLNPEMYCEKMRMLALRNLFSGFVTRIRRSSQRYDTPSVLLPIDDEKLKMKLEKCSKYAEEHGYSYSDIRKWINDSEGAFEPFELDCTTHGLKSEEFIWLLIENNAWSIVDSLLLFQDDEVRNKLIVEIADFLTPISLH